MAIIIVAVVGFGIWAVTAALEGAVVAQGTIIFEGKRKSVQHLEGGIVDRILIRDGDEVEAGQLLVRLDETRARTNLALLSSRIDLLKAREARLNAELGGRQMIEFPDDLMARREEPNTAEIIRGEIDLFLARATTLEGKTDILRQRIAQLEQQIVGLDAQQAANVAQIGLIEEELEGLRALLAKGDVAKPRLLELERRQAGLMGERGQHIAEIARARDGIIETQLQIIQIRNDFQEEAATQLHGIQAELYDLQERSVAAADELRRLDIRAPQAGVVVELDVHTRGAVISAGQRILDIVPQDDELIIQAQVAPRDIDKVTIGLDAVVRLSAFDLRTTPELNAAVFAMSADQLVDEATNNPYFLVEARIPEVELAKLEQLDLKPGMPAEIIIETGQRTALSYLIKPISDVMARAFKDG
jgi:HlyD family type I secretion membrane fusion protein